MNALIKKTLSKLQKKMVAGICVTNLGSNCFFIRIVYSFCSYTKNRFFLVKFVQLVGSIVKNLVVVHDKMFHHGLRQDCRSFHLSVINKGLAAGLLGYS